MPTLEIPFLPVERFRLDNGLRVVLQPDSSLPLVAVNIWYHVGSKNERPGRTGLAHLFEHMLFQGSQNVDTNGHFQLIQQVGGVANGSTWFDRTNYYETLPADFLDLALWLESDRMGYLLPALDEAKLDNQRNVVINERRQRVDNQPYGRAIERAHELLYPADHPYHWPVIGYLDDVRAAQLADVQSFFRAHYTPNNAVLTLTGDFVVERAWERIEHYFGDIPAGETSAPVSRTGLAEAPGTYEEMQDRVRAARIYLAVSMPPFGEPSWYAADLLAAVLSGGKTSPLYRELVYTQQIATDVSAFLLPTELAATFMVIATAKPETEVGELRRCLEQLLDRAISTQPSEVDMERARNRLVTALSEELQKLDQRADLLSMYTTFFDDPERIRKEIRTYASLEPGDLTEVAAEFLAPERRVVLAVVPATRDPEP